MAGTPIWKKLGVKPQHRVLLLNAPVGYPDQLGPLPEGVDLSDAPHGLFDVVHLFAKNKAELERNTPIALQSLKPGGLLWCSYPKRTSKLQTDLTRDVGWDMLINAGFENVTQVSIDEVWSAGRFIARS